MTQLQMFIIALFCLIIKNNAQKMQNSCEYHCPDKKKTPWNKKGYVFQSNGCGAMGMRVNVDQRIKHCCDTHDSCYGS